MNKKLAILFCYWKFDAGLAAQLMMMMIWRQVLSSIDRYWLLMVACSRSVLKPRFDSLQAASCLKSILGRTFGFSITAKRQCQPYWASKYS